MKAEAKSLTRNVVQFVANDSLMPRYGNPVRPSVLYNVIILWRESNATLCGVFKEGLTT